MASLNDFMRSTSSFAEEDKKKKMQEQIDKSVGEMQKDLADPMENENVKVLGKDTDTTASEIKTVADAKQELAQPEEKDELAKALDKDKGVDKQGIMDGIGQMFGGGQEVPQYKMKNIDIGKNTDSMAARRKALMDMLR